MLLQKSCITIKFSAVLRQCMWLCFLPSLVSQMNCRSVWSNTALISPALNTQVNSLLSQLTCIYMLWITQNFGLNLAWFDLVTLSVATCMAHTIVISHSIDLLFFFFFYMQNSAYTISIVCLSSTDSI